MSHYHLEIVMPPTEKIDAAVQSVMARFDEHDAAHYASFWDFWVIGGRWAGTKRLACYDKAKITEFHAWCEREKITVSAFTAGKQEIAPASQIPKVDAKWQEMFPSDPPIPCPLFKHSNDQYGRNGKGTLPDDVAFLRDVVPSVEMARVIIAAVPFNSDGEDEDTLPEAQFMLVKEEWNGVNFMRIAWDGTLGEALVLHQESMKNYHNPDYVAHVTPKSDWLVVTVDYHS